MTFHARPVTDKRRISPLRARPSMIVDTYSPGKGTQRSTIIVSASSKPTEGAFRLAIS
jgi:hypothetical protein